MRIVRLRASSTARAYHIRFLFAIGSYEYSSGQGQALGRHLFSLGSLRGIDGRVKWDSMARPKGAVWADSIQPGGSQTAAYAVND